MSQRDYVEDSERVPVRVQRKQRNCPDGLIRDYVEVVKAMLGEKVQLALRVMDRVKPPQEIHSVPRDMARVAEKIPGENRRDPCDSGRDPSRWDQLERPA